MGLKETSKDKKGFFIEAGAADGEGQILANVIVIFKSRPILYLTTWQNFYHFKILPPAAYIDKNQFEECKKWSIIVPLVCF